MKKAIALLVLVLIPAQAIAASDWYQLNPETGASVKVQTRASNKTTYKTTIDSSTASVGLNVADCKSWSVDAKTVASSATVSRCTSTADSSCVDALSADLAEGDSGYWPSSSTVVVKITGATSGDVLELTCGG